MTGTVRVRLLELPLHLHERSRAHSDGLLREFRLLQGQPRGDSDVPARLLELVATLRQSYSSSTDAQNEQIEDALERGDEVLPELVYDLPPAAAEGARALGAAFDEADEFCRQGQHLLMLATPPDLVRYRRWYLQEFVRQTAGEPATPWPAYAEPGG